MTVRPVGAELFHEDGRTDMTKLMAAFRNCANAPRNDPSNTIRTINRQFLINSRYLDFVWR